jgi:hypothetical protein
MKRAFTHTALATAFVVAVAIVGATAQPLPADEQQALRARVEQRYDVVPLAGGVALTPKSPRGDVRLVEISDTIAINGVAVSGRELRDRLGADADTILRLSYLGRDDLRKLFAREPAPDKEPQLERPSQVTPPAPPPPEPPERPSRPLRRSGRDRVRIFGDVVVHEGEEVTGQVVSVLGSVRIDGEVSQEVVAVLGTIELGPRAVVHGDVVSVGGRLRRDPGAQVGGSVTEVSLGDFGTTIDIPWGPGWGPFHFGGFGPVTRLVGTTFRLVLLALLASIALVVARRAVEGSAQRVTDEPVRATLVGFAAWALILPVFMLVGMVLAISIVGIPLLILLPFALLFLMMLALVGFSGTAAAVGQWTRRRFGMASVSVFADLCLGILVILLPVLIARVVAFAGWTVSPLVFLLVTIGLAVEFLAWSSGFGAILTNAYSRWQATRAARATPPASS